MLQFKKNMSAEERLKLITTYAPLTAIISLAYMKKFSSNIEPNLDIIFANQNDIINFKNYIETLAQQFSIILVVLTLIPYIFLPMLFNYNIKKRYPTDKIQFMFPCYIFGVIPLQYFCAYSVVELLAPAYMLFDTFALTSKFILSLVYCTVVDVAAILIVSTILQYGAVALTDKRIICSAFLDFLKVL